MIQFFAKYKWLGITLLVLSAIIVSVIYSLKTPTPKLPVFQPSEVNPELVDSSIQYVRRFHTIADFELVNQNGKTITQEDYAGKIYVADFFFTTCQSICPIMTNNMAHLQEVLKNDEEVMLLSFSVTPKIDSVARLKEYALKKGVNPEKWNLLTGSKKEIYALARKSYLVTKTKGNGGEYDMIHTENFVLVDKEKRIRGFYDGTEPEAMEKLLKDIEILKMEYHPDSGFFF